MLNFVLCDDNKVILDKLSKMLESIFIESKIDASVSFCCTDPDELLNYTKNNKVDVLILDIDLKSNLSGIDIANKIREVNKDAYIIFITAHLEYILIAYQCKTFDYIPKPITKERVKETIDRLLDDINGKTTKNSFIRINNRNTIINQDNVNYIKKDGMKLVFHTDTRTYEVYSSFNKIINKLPNNFIRCHKSYIANINKINNIDYKNNSIDFSNSTEDICYIGPKYKNKMMEVLNNGNITNNLDCINN